MMFCHAIVLEDCVGAFYPIGNTLDGLKKAIKLYANRMAQADEYRHITRIRFWFNNRTDDRCDDDDILHEICLVNDDDKYNKYGRNIIKSVYTCLGRV